MKKLTLITAIWLLCSAPSYVLFAELKDGGETIIDSQTNLQWLKQVSEPLMPNDAGFFCQTSTVNGLNDWRLPTIYELKQLYNTYKKSNALDKPQAITLRNRSFWTLSTTTFTKTHPWRLHLTFGKVSDQEEPGRHRALCVRTMK